VARCKVWRVVRDLTIDDGLMLVDHDRPLLLHYPTLGRDMGRLRWKPCSRRARTSGLPSWHATKGEVLGVVSFHHRAPVPGWGAAQLRRGVPPGVRRLR
jgi:hypothetical protein